MTSITSGVVFDELDKLVGGTDEYVLEDNAARAFVEAISMVSDMLAIAVASLRSLIEFQIFMTAYL